MDYKKVYDALILRAKGRKLDRETAYEDHHIVPCFMYKKGRNGEVTTFGHLDGDCNDKSNMVMLTRREHFIAHLLMVKFVEPKYRYSAVGALRIMSGYMHVEQGEMLGDTSRKYEVYRGIVSKRYSEIVKGTIVVRDVSTGEIVGRVPLDHPKYVSGEWVFYQKGMKRSDEFKDKQRKPGAENSNHSGFDDEVLVASYLELCGLCEKFLPSKDLWIRWAIKHDKPYLQHIKDFRFEGKGFTYLYEKGEEHMGFPYNEYFTRQTRNREFVAEMENKLGVPVKVIHKKPVNSLTELKDSYAEYVADGGKPNLRLWALWASEHDKAKATKNRLATLCDVNLFIEQKL